MINSIHNQKIEKRRSPVKSARPIVSAPGEKVREKVDTIRIKRRVRKWLSENRRAVSFYGIGILCIGFFSLFLTSSISVSLTPMGGGALVLPDTHELNGFLFETLGPGEEEPEHAVELPPTSILTSIEPVAYTVRKGDTLSEIAQEYSLKLGTLINFNNITDVRRVQVGTVLRIPNRDGIVYTVKKGDSLRGIADDFGVEFNHILDANDLETSVIYSGQELFLPGAAISSFELKKALGQLFIYPTSGELSSPFGMRPDPFTGVRRMHYGIDLANVTGTPVVASMEGRVIAVGNSIRSYGNYVILKHQGGYQTVYAHLSKILVSNGQWVNQGQKVGLMGTTGRSTGPHLHFGLYKNENPLDPLKYLQ